MLKKNLLTKKEINFYLILLKLSIKRLKLSRLQFEFLILLECRLQNNCNCLSKLDKQFINFLINQNKKYLENLKNKQTKKQKEILIRTKNIKLSEIKKTIFNYGNKLFFSQNGCEYIIYFNHYANLYVIKIKVPKLQIKYETKRNNLKQVKDFIKNV